MNKYIIGNLKNEDSWIESTNGELNTILREKVIEELIEIDENTIALHLKTNKTLFIKRQGTHFFINLKDKENEST